MDKLSDLPPKQSSPTPQENDVMNQMFGPAEPRTPASKFSRVEWKLLGATTLLFVFLANPWIDQILCKVPYCGGSSISSLITRTVLFVIILIALYMFL